MRWAAIGHGVVGSCRGSRRIRTLILAALSLGAATPVLGQGPPSAASLAARAFDLESAARHREAIVAWRAVLASGQIIPGLLGLERVFSTLGQEDSLLVALDTLIPQRPTEPQLRSAQLRALSSLGRDARARAAFDEWIVAAPRDPAPFREYARILLLDGRAARADTVLRMAAEALGSTRALILEVAQMRAALGLWREATIAWRETMEQQPYFESAAVFSLAPAPAAAREVIRAELSTPSAPLGARQALAFLEIGWGDARAGWRALASLPASDTTVALWRQFAEEAERMQVWGAARDALVALQRVRPDGMLALRGAHAALTARDPATALGLARDAFGRLECAQALADALPIELEALALLGRPSEIESVVARHAAALGGEGVRGQARIIAWGWVRAGDVARARLALKDAPLAAEEAISGWLALFEGDLGLARRALRGADAFNADAVSALALLNRTRAERAPVIGEAFLALARADTARARARFERAADDLPDAAPLLLALSARLATAQRDQGAVALWTRIVREHASAPEAAEADLEWGRALERTGDAAGARERYEHLILSYPGSALVPQARGALERLRVGADL